MEGADGKRSVDGVHLDGVGIVPRKLSFDALALLKVRFNTLNMVV